MGPFASGASGSVDFAVTVNATVPAGFTLVQNTATIADDGANGPDEDPTDNTSTDETPLTAGPDLYVNKDDFRSVVFAGDTLTYSISYGNEGTIGATGVVLTETLPAGTTFNAAASSAGWTETSPGSGIFELSVGSLAASDTGFATFAVIVDDPLAAGIDQIVNSVSIADDGTNGPEQDTSDNTATDTDVVDAAPDLYVSKDDGQAVVFAGQVLTYTIDYGNAGSQAATGVVLTESIPSGVSFNAAGSAAGWMETSPGSRVFELSLGGLAANETGTVPFSVIVDDPLAAGIEQLVNNITIADDGTNGVDQVPDDNMDSDTDTVIAAPDLVITKDDGGVTTTPGGTVIYTLSYSNVGSQDATGVVITENLPTNTTFDPANSTSGWSETAPGSGIYEFNVGGLASGASGTVEFAVTVDTSVPAGFTLVQNTTTIADDGSNGADEDTSNNTGNDDTPLATAVDLVLTVDDGQTTTAAGDGLVYAVNYQNVGNTTATGVVITQTLPTGTMFDPANSTAGWVETSPGSGVYQLSVGMLAAGGMGSVDFAVTVNDPVAAGLESIADSASITDDGASGADPTPANNIDDDIDTLVAAPDLFVTKDDGQSVVTAGDSISYTINYGNDGSQGATGVVLTETLPAGVAFDAANSTAGWTETSPGSRVFNLTIGSLASGQMGSATFAVTVNDPLAAGVDDLVNNVSIADDGTNGPDEDPTDNQDSDTDTVDAAPDLVITKDDGGITTTPGGTVIYTLTYSNIGSQDATGVFITEILPENTTFDAANSTAGWIQTAPGSRFYRLDLGDLASGGFGMVDFAVTVDATVPAGFDLVQNSASISNDLSNGLDEDISNNLANDDTPVVTAVDLVLTVDDGQTTTVAGDGLVYAVDYQNVGTSDATGVVITQTLPVGTTFDAANSSPGWVETAPGSGVYELSVGSLAAGGMGSVNFAVTVDDPVAAGLDTIVDNASITDDGASGADPTPSNNVDDDIDLLNAAPNLYVTKDDGQSIVAAGNSISYTIDFGNSGSQGATGVVLTETLPAGVAFDASNSTAGWTETSPGSGVFNLNVGSLASGQMGSATFAVTVDNPLAAGIDQLINNVSIGDDGANGVDEDPTDNQDSDTDTVTAAPDLVISKDDGGVSVAPGGTVVYTLSYSNVGSQDATGVVITETVPANTTFDATNSTSGWTETSPGSGVFEFNLGALNSGDSGTVDFAVTVDVTVPAGFSLVQNTATIADDGSNGPDEDPTDNTGSDDTPLSSGIAPDLYVTKDDFRAVAFAGDGLVYSIDYGNEGTIGATGVIIRETLPAGTTFSPLNSTPGWVETAPGTGVYEFSVGTLNPSATGFVQFAVTVDNPLAAGIEEIVNNVEIFDDGSNGADVDPSDNTATDTDTLDAAPDLYVSKNDGQSVVVAGDTLTYVIDYGNDGTQHATGVVLTETIPAGVSFNAAGSTAGWTETSPGSGVFELSLGTVLANDFGTVNFSVIVDDPLAAGISQLLNHVMIMDDGTNGPDQIPDDNEDTDTDTVIAAPDLVITKDDGGVSSSPGGTIVYTLNYSNVGSQGATGVVITENLPNNTTFDAANSTAGWTETSPGSGVFEFNVGALASGVSGTVDFAVTVDSNVPAGFNLVQNTTTITDDGANGPDEDITDNTGSDNTPLAMGIDLVLMVDDGQTTTVAGAGLVYTLDYQNVGDTAATGVVITETLPVGTTFDAANSSPGWTETAPGSGIFEFNVGTLAAGGMGNVQFAVTVDDPVAAGLDSIVDNASITDDGANGADPTPSNNVDSDTDVLTAAPDLYVTKDDSQSVVVAGDSIVYSIMYGNDGSQDATGVVLTETLPAGVAFDAANSSFGWNETSPGSGVFELAIGDLMSGQMGSVTFAVTVDDPLAAGIDELLNNVSIADDGTNGADEDPTDNQDTDLDTVDAAPDLVITKDDGGVTTVPGGTVVYTLTYSNVGSQDATGTFITEILPENTTFDPANSTAGWTQTAPGSRFYRLDIGDLNVGDSGSVDFAVIVDSTLPPGFNLVQNSASISNDLSNGLDEDISDNLADDDTPVLTGVDLVLTVDDGQTTTTPGDNLVYTLDYQNVGTGTATGVVITQNLPTGTTFDAANSSAGWTETSPGSGIFELNVGSLNSGENGSVMFAVTVDDPLAAGIDTIVDTASITDDGSNGADPTPANNVDTDTDVISAAPDLFVTKDDGQSVVTAGSSVVYTINYGNDGAQGATGVVLTETLPAGVTFDAANSSPGWTETTPGSGIFELAVGDVASGQMASATFAVTVNDPLASGIDQLVNNVVIADDGTNGADEDPTDNQDSDTDTVDAAPDLVITKDDGGVTTVPGGTVVYTLSYSNVGSQDATGTFITEILPENTTFDPTNSTAGWTQTAPGSRFYRLDIGDLNVGDSGSVDFAVIVDSTLPPGFNLVQNSASISNDLSNGLDEDISDNLADDDTPVLTDIDLVLTVDDGQTTTMAGDGLVYTIDYQNVGTAAATGVVITETLPVGTTFDATNSTAGWTETAPGSGIFELSVGSLLAGESGSVQFAVVVDDPTAAGLDSIVNNASITDDGASGADPTPANNVDDDIDTLNAAPNLFVTKDDGLAVVMAGDSVIYTVNYGNIGSQGATGVVLTETLPAGTTFDAANSSAGWTETAPGSRVFELSVGNVDAGVTGSATFAVTVNNPLAAGIDDLVNAVSIADDGTNGADEDPTDNQDTDTDIVTAAPDLVVSKDDGGVSVTPGGTVIYTLSFANVGSQDATGVMLTETLPANTSFDPLGSTAGWTETAPGSGIYTFAVGDLDSGTTGTVDFAVVLNSSLPPGFALITNTTSISDDGTNGPDENPTDNTGTDDTPVVSAPDLTVTVDDGVTTVAAADGLIYDINYANVGNIDSTGVVLTETLPVGTSFDAASSTAGWTETAPGSGIFELSIGTLMSGDSGTVQFAVTVDDPAAAGIDSIVNQVTISDDGSNGADPTPANNVDDDIDTLVAAPDLYVIKDDSQSVASAGNRVSYAIAFGNIGTQDATGVVITETLPVGSTFDSLNSTPGWTETSPGSGVFEFNVGNLSAGATGSTVTFAIVVDDPLAAGIDQLVNNISITDDGTNGVDTDLTNNQDSDTNVLIAVPDLYVTHDDGQSVVQVGDSLVYSVEYGNIGMQGATNVVLTETLPAGVTFDPTNSSVGWTETAPGSGVYELNVGSVPGGSTGSMVQFAITVDDPAAAGVDSLLATITIADDGANGIESDLTNNSDDDIDTLDAAPDLAITNDDGGVQAVPGGTVIYTLDYSNVGPQDATGVVITETLPANTTFDATNSTPGWTETAPGSGVYEYMIGDLASGASGMIEFAVVVDVNLPAGVTMITDDASIADDGSNGPETDLTNNADSEDTPITSGGIDLAVTIDDGQTTTTPGGSLIYTLDYQNLGNVASTGVVITQNLPAGTTFDPANSSAGWVEASPGSGVYEFMVGSLPSSDSGSVQFAVTVDDPVVAGLETVLADTTIADDGANGVDINPTNNSDQDIDTLDAAPDLFVTKDDGATVVSAGQSVVYTIEYGNDGSQSATGVVLTETIPAGATFDAANSTSGWVETSTGSGVYQLVVGDVPAGSLGNTVTFAVTVNDPLAAGMDQLVNNVSITDDGTNGADEDPTDNQDSDTDDVLAAPDLVISKDDGDVSVTPGGTVTYTLTYSNVGTQDATAVVVTETLPANTSFDSANSSAGWVETSPGSGVFEFSAGAVAVGEIRSITFAVTVDAVLPAGFTLVDNVASIADDGTNGPDEDPTNNMDNDTTPIVNGVDLVGDCG